MGDSVSTYQKLKHSVRGLVDRPWGMRVGSNSRVRRSFSIHGRQYISIGTNTNILSHIYISAIDLFGNQHFTPHIHIGNNVYIGSHAYLAAIDGINIGDLSVLSDHVYITDVFHGMHPDRGPIMEQPLESKGPVIIGRCCFLGYRCAVMPGVTLGDHCIVGANSVVTHSFPAYSMVAGAPARRIKQFDLETRQWVTVAA